MNVNHNQALAKALIWRFLISMPTGFIITWDITGEIKLSLFLTAILTVVMTTLYYTYERVWQALWKVITRWRHMQK